MRRVHFSLAVVFGVPLLLVVPFATSARAQAGNKITFGMNPTIFRAGQPASAELSISSVSISPLTLNSGFNFMFFVDSSLAVVQSVSAPVAVESASLSPGDFSVSFAGGQNPIIVAYTGSPKTFSFGDCLSVKVSLIVSSHPGPGKLSLSSQLVAPVNGVLPFTTVSIVDFANSGTSSVTHDQTLIGDGTTAMPLGIAPGGVTTTELATGAVTASKIAAGQVVKSLNGLRDDVTLVGSGLTGITPAGNTLTISSAISRDATLTGNGTAGSPLGLAMFPKAMLSVAEDGTLVACYNGVTGELQKGGTTLSGCGFSISKVTVGGAPDSTHVHLPSSINALFFSITPIEDSTSSNIGAMAELLGGGSDIFVDLFYADDKKGKTNAPFIIIVY
jgi:hypothetical protein